MMKIQVWTEIKNIILNNKKHLKQQFMRQD